MIKISATPPSRVHKAAVEAKTEQQELLLYDLRFVVRVVSTPLLILPQSAVYIIVAQVFIF